jgi:hypothetical protein
LITVDNLEQNKDWELVKTTEIEAEPLPEGVLIPAWEMESVTYGTVVSTNLIISKSARWNNYGKYAVVGLYGKMNEGLLLQRNNRCRSYIIKKILRKLPDGSFEVLLERHGCDADIDAHDISILVRKEKLKVIGSVR